jgi:hypothetical protein
MKTFAKRKKISTPAASRPHYYVHPPKWYVQKAHQTDMCKILRPDEVLVKSDIIDNDGKFQQESEHARTEVPIPSISRIVPVGPGGLPSFQRFENEEEDPMQAKLIQRKMVGIRGIQPSRFVYVVQEVISQQAGVREILRSTGSQTRLTIDQPNDKYEQEADRVADQVMRMSDADVAKRQAGDEREREMLQAIPLADKTTPVVHRMGEPPRGGNSLAKVERGVHFLKGGGAPLSKSERAYFEPRIGADLSQVRVHAGSKASRLARSINAKAFTVGNNIVFAPGKYGPESSSAKRLMAHELIHVVQQAGGSPQGGRQMVLRAPDDPPSAPSTTTASPEVSSGLGHDDQASETRRMNAQSVVSDMQDVIAIYTSSAMSALNDWAIKFDLQGKMQRLDRLAARVNTLEYAQREAANTNNFFLAVLGNALWVLGGIAPPVALAKALQVIGGTVSALSAYDSTKPIPKDIASQVLGGYNSAQREISQKYLPMVSGKVADELMAKTHATAEKHLVQGPYLFDDLLEAKKALYTEVISPVIEYLGNEPHKVAVHAREAVTIRLEKHLRREIFMRKLSITERETPGKGAIGPLQAITLPEAKDYNTTSAIVVQKLLKQTMTDIHTIEAAVVALRTLHGTEEPGESVDLELFKKLQGSLTTAPRFKVRLQAAALMIDGAKRGKLRVSIVTPELINALHDDVSIVRALAANGLAELSATTAIPFVYAALRREDDSFATEEMKNALAKLAPASYYKYAEIEP